MPGTYNANANVMQLADALVSAPDAKGRLYAKMLEDGAAQYDDFSQFEGAIGRSGSTPNAVFIRKNDFKKAAGDKMTFTVQSDVAGPGVRGEQELTGNTSTVEYHTYDCIVDYWRDAFEVNQKKVKFMAAGGDITAHCIKKLRKKLGRQRMYDMKVALIKKATGNIIRPNGRKNRDDLLAIDTLQPGFLPQAKPQVQRVGAKPLAIKRNQHGSPVHSYIVYASDVAMESIRNSTSYQNALLHAQSRSDGNPTFSGRLVDWQGLYLFEHITVDPDWDDKLSDPTAPRALLKVAFSANSAAGDTKLKQSASNTSHRYFEWFPGYDYQWYEGQAASPDTTRYYAWVITPDQEVGFVSYLGTANDGNEILVDQILSPAGAGVSGKGLAVVGNIDATGDGWGGGTPGPGGVGSGNTDANYVYTDSFAADSYIIPANANGTPIGYTFMFGKGAAVRGYGSTDTYITQNRDYDFVKGAGYQCIFGQAPCERTDGKTHNYGLLEHAIQHQGLEVPAL